jgi:predicted enzyme related to lactoylglutathione lyase
VERVVGIGGVFFRAKDADALRGWYGEHLGIDLQEWGGAPFEGGTTVWAIFPGDTEYFGRSEQQAKVNYRVNDLDAMRAQLRAAGASVDDKVEDSELGRFGWATDPEGNRFELWQPPSG